MGLRADLPGCHDEEGRSIYIDINPVSPAYYIVFMLTKGGVMRSARGLSELVTSRGLPGCRDEYAYE